MHRPLFVLAAGSVAAVGGLLVASAMPAGAATSVRAETMALYQTGPGPTEGTPVTFTVTTTGTLSISAPLTTVDLGSAAVGRTVGFPGNFGAVTVLDNRGVNPAGWIATVSCTDFANAANTADIIPVSDATYLVPPVGSLTGDVATVGAIAPVPGAAALPLPGTTIVPPAITQDGTLLDNASPAIPIPLTGGATPPAAVVTVTGADGDNGATWDPTITVAIPAHAVVGVYDGTVTHSVS